MIIFRWPAKRERVRLREKLKKFFAEQVPADAIEDDPDAVYGLDNIIKELQDCVYMEWRDFKKIPQYSWIKYIARHNGGLYEGGRYVGSLRDDGRVKLGDYLVDFDACMFFFKVYDPDLFYHEPTPQEQSKVLKKINKLIPHTGYSERQNDRGNKCMFDRENVKRILLPNYVFVPPQEVCNLEPGSIIRYMSKNDTGLRWECVFYKYSDYHEPLVHTHHENTAESLDNVFWFIKPENVYIFRKVNNIPDPDDLDYYRPIKRLTMREYLLQVLNEDKPVTFLNKYGRPIKEKSKK